MNTKQLLLSGTQKPACLNSLKTWFLLRHASSRFFATQEFLEEAEDKLLKRPAYSPDFDLFPYVKPRIRGQRFSLDEESVAAFREERNFIPKQMWERRFDEWFLLIKKSINCNGKYLEKL